MPRKVLKKKVLGSVAVDSQTGMEHYQTPKDAEKSSASVPPNGVTPNYGQKTDGQTQNLAGVPDEFMALFEHDPSEVILKQGLKHPIGTWFILGVAIISIVLVLFGTSLLLTDSVELGMGESSVEAKALGSFVALILCVMIAAIAFAAMIVYRKSRIILTNQKLVYIRYHSLFSREISQLNIGEVEDVNVAQHSIWDRIFKMGTLTIETAGEQNNYVFTHVINAHEFARLTIQAHEGSIAEYGN
jgi:membrane protein YdbS with pleckstrin-like domain